MGLESIGEDQVVSPVLQNAKIALIILQNVLTAKYQSSLMKLLTIAENVLYKILIIKD